jgi:hypothetical protein
MLRTRQGEPMSIISRSSRLNLFLFILLATIPALAGFSASPCQIDVTVQSCQGIPMSGFNVVLVGEQEAEDKGDGQYTFSEVEMGKHRLLVWSDYGEPYSEEFESGVMFAYLKVEAMIDICIETALTHLEGKVIDEKGRPVKDAEVAVDSLFLTTQTDGKGRFVLEVPPGDWAVVARWSGKKTEYRLNATEPEDGGSEISIVKHDFALR